MFRSSPQILVAHPDAAIRKRLVNILTFHITPIAEASQAEEVITVCQKNTFSVILLAADWPDGDAYDMVARIRQTTADHTRIFMMVRTLDRATLDHLYQTGGDDFLIEPIHEQDVRKKLLPFITLPLDYRFILESMARNSKDAMGLYFNGQFEFVNSALKDLSGYDETEICSPDFDILGAVGIESRQLVSGYLARFAAGEEIESCFDFVAIHKDGYEIHVEAFVICLPYKDGTAVWGVLRDITGLKTAKRREQEMAREKAYDLRRYESLFEQSNDAIFIADSQGNYIASNQRAIELFGYDADELRNLPVSAVIAPEEIAAYQQVTEKLLAGEHIPPYERIFRHKDGHLLTIEVNVEFVSGENGEPLYIQSILRDITERKQVEADERRQRHLAEALRDTAVVLNSTLDLNVVLDQILIQAARVVPHTTSSVALIEGQEVRIVRCRGYQQRGQDEKTILSLRFPLDVPSNYRRIMESKRALVVSDTRAWPDWIYKPEVAWIRSNLTAPILAWGEVIGFLHVDSEIPNQFNDKDAEALLSFASQVAMAVSNARIHAQAEIMNRATAFLFASLNKTDITVLGQEIVQTVVNEFGQLDCGLLLVEQDTGDVIRLARAGAYRVNISISLSLTGQGLVPYAMRSGQTIYAPDVRQHPRYLLNDSRTLSELAIPLFNSRKEVMGALDMQSEELNAFTENDLLILNAFAERAAMALENAQHTKTLEIHVEERTRQLRETTEQIEAIFEYTSDAIILIGLDGRIERSNTAFRQLFKVKEAGDEEVLLKDLVVPESAADLEQALADVVAYNQPREQEIVAHALGETSIDLEIALSPLLASEGQVSGIVCVMHDITRRKQDEYRLLEAVQREREFHELRASFMARASHEFRTPLAVMMTSAELLRNYYDRMAVEQRDKRLGQIEDQIQNMVHLIDNMSILNQSVPYQPLDGDDVTANAVRVCEQTIQEIEVVTHGSHSITFSHPDHDVILKMDENSLRHIVNKLVENAVKFSVPGSSVKVTLEQVKNQATLTVQDQGIGIPEADQERLFEVFYRGSNAPTNQGAGLGLVIVKKIVDFYGGSVIVSSQVNVGTSFIITFPCKFLAG